ncbi:MAG TPA: SDR family oxidoreductase [Pirellulaceae bacterium]|nr:SDR family oxidoreductase [Pirellulaceae bacterium]
MNLDLTQRSAVVCGSSQGIGLAAAIELARLGASITLVARDSERLQLAISKLPRSLGKHHDFMAVDFQQPEQVSAVISEWVRRGHHADILVNNAGGPAPGPVRNASIAELRGAFDAHLIVNQILVEHLSPGMIERGYGRIINVISTSVKQPIPGLGVSNTIRGAVANWAKTLAGELAPYGVTVNNVLPGATRTARLEAIIETSAAKHGVSADEAEQRMLESIPAKRFAEPHEVGAAIAFLASPAAAYITGINLPVDGGRTSCL